VSSRENGANSLNEGTIRARLKRSPKLEPFAIAVLVERLTSDC